MVARVDTAPQAVGTPPHSLIADGLRFVEPAPPGEDKFPSPDQNHLTHLQLQQTRWTKTVVPRIDAAPHGVGTPTWAGSDLKPNRPSGHGKEKKIDFVHRSKTAKKDV